MSKENKSITLTSLFFECFFLSLFTFGGGSTIIALLQKKFVEKLKWINESEMLEMMTLAQTTPGATSVNTAMLIGYRLFGLRGALVSAIGSALPPMIVISIITLLYDQIQSSNIAANALRGVRACAAALVASVSISLSIYLCKKKNYFNIAVWISAVIAVVVFRVNVLFIVLAGLVAGILHFLLFKQIENQVNL